VREAATICLHPSTPHATAQQALRLQEQRPVHLASSSCGCHEYLRCTRQTDVSRASSLNSSALSWRRHKKHETFENQS